MNIIPLFFEIDDCFLDYQKQLLSSALQRYPMFRKNVDALGDFIPVLKFA